MIPGNANPLLLASAAAADAAAGPIKSLRFNSGDSAHLSKTYSSAGNRKKWTWSAWVKLCSTSTGRSRLFGVSGANTGSPYNFATNIGFNDNKICFTNHANDVYSTDAVFRDYSAWYHIVVALDTTDATTANRVKIYVNGVLQDKTHPGHGGAAEPSQNTEYAINSTLGPHTLGASPDTSGTAELFFDGYMADIHFIDGSALAPTSFGAYDDNGIWQAAVYSGTYGTNGFHLLDFENEATIGHDSSGNNNDFTANNLSDETTTLPGVNFTSSTSDHLDHPTSTDFNFTGDFTIECYVKVTAYNASNASTIAGTGSNSWSFGLTAAGNISFGHYGVQGFFSGGGSVLEGVWTHVAVARSGSSVKGFINGVEEVSTTYSASMSNTNELYIGNDVSNSSQHFNGVISNLNIVQGTALYTSNFSPPTTPLSAHANTKLLCCQSNSSTTAATVAPGTLTANGSVTAGDFTDSGFNSDVLFDVPTNGTQSDTGAGGEVSGNYCTWNPSKPTSGTFSQGNLRFAGNSQWRNTDGTIAVSSGKWYYEATYTGGQYGSGSGNLATGIGFKKIDANLPEGSNQDPVNSSTYRSNTLAFYQNGYFTNFSTYSSVTTQIAPGDVVGVSINYDAGTYAFYVNGSSVTSGSLSYTGELIPWAQAYFSTDYYDCNFGQRTWAYSAPSNHKPLCTALLPTPTIADGSDYFDTSLWTGNGSTQSITGLGFSPDLVWIKMRSAAAGHRLYDTVRGATKFLVAQGTDAEATQSAGLTSFDSAGFSLGSNFDHNNNNSTFVGWAWDAGSSTVSNTDGSITSQVRANQSAGFSILTFTNTTSNSTVGHGLNAKPDMIIWKKTSGTSHWPVYHSALGATKYVYLNLTNAAATGSEFWNNTEPTSSVISTKGEPNSMGSAGDTVMYVFTAVPGFSAFGSYEGNGSTSQGPFIYTGFAPAFLIFRRYNDTGDWIIFDNKRNTHEGNYREKVLYSNKANAEEGAANGDTHLFLSNGFAIDNVNFGFWNASGDDYLWAAFAENPFQANGGLAR